METFIVWCSTGGYGRSIELLTCDEDRANKAAEGSDHLFVESVMVEDVGKGIEKLLERPERRW
jgi:hypothetical protein